MKALVALALTIATSQAFADITYFSCPVKEGRKNVVVKFAIKNLDTFKEKGELINYPGANEEYGMILVQPESAIMANLNGQGGDLRLGYGTLRLWGDGDGYQFTDLVLWDLNDEDRTEFEGYVRDYGPARGKEDSFKQFIKCKKSNKKL